jgi:hypothetical protein
LAKALSGWVPYAPETILTHYLDWLSREWTRSIHLMKSSQKSH